MNFKRFHESKNLFDGAYTKGFIGTTYIYKNTNTSANCAIIPCEPSTTYSVKKHDDSNRFAIGTSNVMPYDEIQLTGVYYVDTATEYTFTTDNSAHYMVVYVSTGTEQAEPRLMVNTGSQPLPYEPYSSEVWHDIPHYIHNTSTDTLTTLPADIYANDTTATVGLKGQMEQTGTPSPTTPIQPSECGERTGNLYDYHKSFNNTIVYNEYFDYYLLQLKPNTTYTAYTNCESINLSFGTHRTSYIITPDEDTFSTANGGVDKNNARQITTKASGIVKVGLRTYDDSSMPIPVYTEQDFSSGNVWLMLAEGAYTNQTMPAYEPYGQYKIPILNNSQTTPVYLGEVQTTRRIKKLVLKGSVDENITLYTIATGNLFRIELPTLRIQGQFALAGICSHYRPVILASDRVDGTISGGDALSVQGVVDIVDNYATVEDFKAYLQQQYANGTPVCVWYVLATETTGIVNEPLRKIGTYADEVSGITIPTIAGANTLSVDTTLQPSEVSVNYKGWHPVVNVHEYDSNYTIATMQALTIAQLQTHTISELQGGEWS